jgi:hypothetical protein
MGVIGKKSRFPVAGEKSSVSNSLPFPLSLVFAFAFTLPKSPFFAAEED